MERLLIKQSEFLAHQSALSSITGTPVQLNINDVEWLYMEVTNQQAFDNYKQNLNANKYGDGILLPPGALGR